MNTRSSAPISRREWVGLSLILAMSLVARGWGAWDSMGIDHFDEGVYALSAHGLAHPEEPGRLWPDQIKFSPPVYIGLAAAVHAATGLAADRAALVISIAAGVCTVLALWGIGRRWFDPATGITAAFLLALSEYHIGLSRSGLTDATFALLFLLAIAACTRAASTGRAGSAVVAGAMVGVAWNTKYHGWLAAAITGVGIAAFVGREWLGPGGDWRRRLRGLLPWALVPLVAILLYLPWFLFVQSQPGGYTGLVEYQRTLLSYDWLGNLARTLEFQRFLDGPWSRASIPISVAVAGWALGKPLPLSSTLAVGVIGLSALALALGGWSALLVLSALGVPWLLSKGGRPWLPGLVLSAWLLVWIVLTPLYHPYARLLLPLTVAACLAAAATIVRFLGRISSTAPPAGTALVGAVGLVVFAMASCLPDPSDPWRPSRSVASAVEAMLPELPEGSRVVVLGDPSVAYYLHAAGRPAFESVNGDELPALLEAATGPVYVVFTIYSRRTGAAERNLAEQGARLRLVGRYPLDPKDLRVLDDFRPGQARAFRADPSHAYDVELYEFRP